MSLLTRWLGFAAESSQRDLASAARSINELGLDLLRLALKPDANALLSPYSIQSVLAIAYAGADEETRSEMAKVLHYPAGESAVDQSFAALKAALDAVARTTAERASSSKQFGGPADPVVLTMANRLFGRQGFEFRASYLSLARDAYRAPLQSLDFARDPIGAANAINLWVEEQTRQRIRNLIPPSALDSQTTLVLVNAVYLKAPWAAEFAARSTQPRPFYVNGGGPGNVPTMMKQERLGYAKHDGFTVVTVPYSGGEVQLLILLPDATNGLPALEKKLTPALLDSCIEPDSADVILYLPKFKIEPPLVRLGGALQALGMKTAFDKPKGTANFDRMAPRLPNNYLFISEVFHKAFLALDEKGTEAAAATAVAVLAAAAITQEKPKPIELHVDHPFWFAIQHRPSGACLFLGHVTDPRQ